MFLGFESLCVCVCVRDVCVWVRGQGVCVWCACLCVGRVERRTNVLGPENTVFGCESMFAQSVRSAALSTHAHRSNWMRFLLMVQLKLSKRTRVIGSVGSRPNQSSGDLGPTHFKDICGRVCVCVRVRVCVRDDLRSPVLTCLNLFGAMICIC